MAKKLPKFKMIAVKDFQPSLFGDITFNNITHSTIADFYSISDEQKKILFEIQSNLNDITKLNERKMDDFLAGLIKIHDKLKIIPNSYDFAISDLEVSCKCELHLSYQTDNQKKSKK